MKSTKELQNKLIETLGLSEKEIAIYLALLSQNMGTAARLARVTDINRTTVYDVLERLIKDGLVAKQKKGGKTYFFAEDLESLPAYLDRKATASKQDWANRITGVQQLMPDLLELQLPGVPVPKILVFEGLAGIEAAYEKTLEAHSEIVAYVDVAAEMLALPHYFPEYWQRRAKKRIPIRSLLVDNESGRERQTSDQQELRKSKILPASQSFTAQLKVWDHTILSIAWEEQIATVIESKSLATMQKQIFQSLWDSIETN